LTLYIAATLTNFLGPWRSLEPARFMPKPSSTEATSDYSVFYS